MCNTSHTCYCTVDREREKASQSQHATSHVKKYQRQYYRFNPRFFNEITSELMGCTHSDRARGTNGCAAPPIANDSAGFPDCEELKLHCSFGYQCHEIGKRMWAMPLSQSAHAV